jgi:hypothetical protein
MGAIVPVDMQEQLTLNAPDRVSDFNVDGRCIPTRLAKNPESWRESLSHLSAGQIILSVNAKGIDGLDTSWLWDVDYHSLKSAKVICTGDRRLDVAYRLHVAGVDVCVAESFSQAVGMFTSEPIEAIASYTAFQDLAANALGLSKAVTGGQQ